MSIPYCIVGPHCIPLIASPPCIPPCDSEEKPMDKRDHKQRYDSGLQTRREVLGAGYVDKAMAGVDEFTGEFTELLNTYCWNDVWNRPGLPRKTRSVLNLGMLCALGKE